MATVADGQRDVVDCGAGQDTVEGVADPNDDLAADCESAQRSFEAGMLPKSMTVAARLGHHGGHRAGRRAESFVGHPGHRAPQGSAKKGKVRILLTATAPQATGPAKLRFKLAKLSTGFLSRRPEVRVQIDVVAITADGRHSRSACTRRLPGPLKLVALYDNQLRLKIPARLRHPHGR